MSTGSFSAVTCENEGDSPCYANTSGTNDPAVQLTVTSNGFSINTPSSYTPRWANESGVTYVYMIIR